MNNKENNHYKEDFYMMADELLEQRLKESDNTTFDGCRWSEGKGIEFFPQASFNKTFKTKLETTKDYEEAKKIVISYLRDRGYIIISTHTSEGNENGEKFFIFDFIKLADVKTFVLKHDGLSDEPYFEIKYRGGDQFNRFLLMYPRRIIHEARFIDVDNDTEYDDDPLDWEEDDDDLLEDDDDIIEEEN